MVFFCDDLKCGGMLPYPCGVRAAVAARGPGTVGGSPFATVGRLVRSKVARLAGRFCGRAIGVAYVFRGCPEDGNFLAFTRPFVIPGVVLPGCWFLQPAVNGRRCGAVRCGLVQSGISGKHQQTSTPESGATKAGSLGGSVTELCCGEGGLAGLAEDSTRQTRQVPAPGGM
ncbi:hypothetical protein UVI_02000490 [Ustilaginoidea virens]|uniref:Uncharacterized protein n=1 Tax=Ustilaginoidea virens TaxID=1159556 RepID=A0A1B5KYW3_USTVR|nr:hypothetical protein UVI_02000490 [Ustilaginoidea virens]